MEETNDEAETAGRGRCARDRDRNPVMAQEATQEPGMIGFNYPNSHYVTGGWGVHTPPSWTGR